MKFGIWAEDCRTDLEKSGFISVKPHEFFKINGDVFQCISFQGSKNDIYVWYNSLPISLPDFWPSTGWGRASGRAPEKERVISLAIEENVEAVREKVRELNKSMVLPYLESIENMATLEAAFDDEALPATGYPKAICNFLLGRHEEGKELLNRYIKTCDTFSNIDICKELAELGENELKRKLDDYRIKNVKKYGLKKVDNKNQN